MSDDDNTEHAPPFDPIPSLAARLYATRTDRAHLAAGTWPPHVADSLAALRVALPPRPPATTAQIDAYDAQIAAIERQLTELMQQPQRPKPGAAR